MSLEITAQVIKFFFWKKGRNCLQSPFWGKGGFFFLECVGTISRDTFSGLTEIRVPYVQEMRSKSKRAKQVTKMFQNQIKMQKSQQVKSKSQ